VIVLALDTCFSACGVAVTDGERVLALRQEPMARGHQERLGGMVAETLAETGLDFAALDRIGVTVGPGSFTGLRVGLAFAKGLGLALGRPCVGIGSLEALAHERSGLVVALADARRGQAYWQAFRDGSEATSPGAAGLAEIETWLGREGGPDLILGPGAELLAEAFPRAPRLVLAGADPVAVARLAAAAPEPLAAPHPLYLRTPDAKLPGGIDP
jgi:tRNA threonylcarbamoyladenosine biosynthesis protein TsaB